MVLATRGKGLAILAQLSDYALDGDPARLAIRNVLTPLVGEQSQHHPENDEPGLEDC